MSEVWSYSKSQQYHSCPRSLFYILNANQYTALQEKLPSIEAVSVWAVSGVAVHRSIAKQMDNWALGKSPDFDIALNDALYYLNYIWSKQDQLIIEAINGKKLKLSFYSQMVRSTRHNIRILRQQIWPRFDCHQHAIHEQSKTFSIEEQPVTVKIDLVTIAPDKTLFITDWKTGSIPPLGANTLQLNVYALWAQYQYKIDRNNIIVQLVNLKTGEVEQKKPNSRNLRETIAQIIFESEKWKDTNEQNFQLKPDNDKCLACKFFPICEAGRLEK